MTQHIPYIALMASGLTLTGIGAWLYRHHEHDIATLVVLNCGVAMTLLALRWMP